VHHRKLKKQGGKDELCNLIALCSTCHNIAPNSVHQNPKLSYEMGWMVPSWANPAEWPITTLDGKRIWLDNDGSTRTEEESTNGW
jgi:hypothetical protein